MTSSTPPLLCQPYAALLTKRRISLPPVRGRSCPELRVFLLGPVSALSLSEKPEVVHNSPTVAPWRSAIKVRDPCLERLKKRTSRM
ncbi:hypothetical protein DTO166G4_3381 [Paecilomyces variotii]|nr:hypothetical protein DTO164E3_7386 [Paecilomyces variotii]KAJ9198544.1 hypothetical protein DTO032I3_5429 [Paecilomyces variotii]KAJ9214983.1 hypothetical protein DTO166G4_3381 [Paecilomyces variotii]KAJ9227603.1 hypothetical protein DTO169C6_244 [Paecilomyces variotii]KAJ9236717.1 hypothetical protein DTO166G5_3944 [Paecilomyces variotii]